MEQILRIYKQNLQPKTLPESKLKYGQSQGHWLIKISRPILRQEYRDFTPRRGAVLGWIGKDLRKGSFRR